MRILPGFVIFFFLISFVLTARDFSVNELRTGIAEAAADTQQVKLLIESSEDLADRGEVTAAEVKLDEAAGLADSLNYSYGRQLVLLNRANLFLVKIQPDSAKKVLETALEQYPESSLAKKYYNHLGTAYRFQGKNEQALEYYNKVIALSDTAKDEYTLAAVKQNMAVVYQNMGNKAQALQHYLDGLTYAETVRDTLFLATLVNNIGEAYTDYEEFDKAEHYLQRSLELSEAIDFKVGLLRASLNMANVKSSLGDFDTALTLYRQALDLSARVRPGQPPVRINHNLGRLYYEMGNLDKADEYLKESLSQSEEMRVMEGVYYNSKGLGRVASRRNHIEEAVGWQDKALLVAKELKSPLFQEETHRELHKLTKEQGNYRQALEHLEAFQIISDSLQKLESDQALAEYEAKLNVHRQERINQLLQDKQREQEARLNVQQWLIVTGSLVIVLVLIMVVMLIGSNREKKRINKKLKEQKQDLEQLNEVKNKLFTVVAHDLRTPLSGLKGMLYLFREGGLSREELDNISAQLEVSMENNLNIMENLLVWARQQMEGMTIHVKRVYAKPIVDDILDSHTFYAQKKGVRLFNEVPGTTEVLADPNLLELVVRNLISNSLKFSEAGDYVTVRAVPEDDNILFTVEDTGIGIPDTRKKSIFYSGTETRKGTNDEHGSGLGLTLCKEFIEKQHGNIYFSSEEGKGTTFYFSLPKADKSRVAEHKIRQTGTSYTS